MATHKCAECKFMHGLIDSSDRTIYLCVFDQSMSYLQEVGYCTEDCELDNFGENLWQSKHEEFVYEEW